MEFCFGLFQGSGPKHSASWIRLLFLCSMLPMWSSVEGWSYFYSNTTMNWETARTWCQKHYTDMVAIQNQEEIQHLDSYLPYKSTYYWIGIRKINGAWTWVGTNKKLTREATNWAKNEPNNGKNGGLSGGAEDCVEMYIQRNAQAGKWNDERCDKLKAPLCYAAACKPDSCHYGECVETINSHKCICTPGFFGDKCDQVVKCKDVVRAPENGNISCTHEYGDFSFNSSCQYSCKEGYQLNMERPQRCNEHGYWSEQHPTCELVQCQNLTLPSRGSMTCSDPLGPASYGSTCVHTCDEGYVFDGSPSNALTLQCESSGSWNASQPSCVAVQCPALQHLENGIVSCDSEEDDRVSYGKTCSFSCSPGYQLLGPSMLTCTSTTEWSGQMPHCEAITCKNPKREAHLIANCHKSLKEFPINSTCSFTCEQGFELQGVQTAKCSEDGHWSEDIPTCRAVRCPLLEAPENGFINCSNSEPLFNTQCSFTCDQDYSLNGHEMLTCDHHGNWTGGNSTCEATSPSVTVTATSAAAGAASVASGLCLALWILKRLRQKASKFALNSTSEMPMPTEVYKSSIDSLI